MNNKWFKCRIRYEKTMENGMNKKVNEEYLVDALSFTEAEARIIEQMEPFITGEYSVQDISRASYSEVFTSSDENKDKWYSIIVAFITLDGKSGKEKKRKVNMLVQSCSTNDAEKDLHEAMKGTMVHYVIVEVKETALMDVFFYAPEEETDETR